MDSLLRVIHDHAHDGPTNMARDEALLTLVGTGRSVPTLRTYLWSPPTISLGYFQEYADYERLKPPAGALPVVRRQTGGGAILHDRELTYSLTLPLNHPLLAAGPNTLYQIAHDALMTCLSERGIETRFSAATDGSGPAKGPFFCFARRHRFDVLLGGDKVAGSAQRRTGQAVLQHGSIICDVRYAQQPAAHLSPTADVQPEDLRAPFAAALARRAGFCAAPSSWTAAELSLAADLIAKYADPAWTRRA
ncbi:MAG: hypothetical protein V2A79_13285 [Planctomycetota bacterium]